ncbi:MAG: glycosyltransferase family 2 protein [Parcubacteria group bacterium]|nr:glycosyltransferase family 2 protein [Parcubacteria group bacterium]
MKLSIIIPAYNEEKTMEKILSLVYAAPLSDVEKEVIVINDGSTDRTPQILVKSNYKYRELRIINLERNYGKGYAIRQGIKSATGDIILIQDADLEYDPNDYKKLIEPIVSSRVDVVYGSRNLNALNKKSAGPLFYLGGVFLSFLANILYGLKITDEPTCYKVFKADLLKNLSLTCNRFEFCPEVTAKIGRRKIKIEEVPILYYPRTKKEGKKIAWRDGVQAVWVLIKHRFVE